MNSTPFEKFPKILRRASHYRSKTDPDVFIKLSHTDKIIFNYMADRFIFFMGRYFDKQGAIAEECDVNIKTVTRLVRGFVDSGIFEIKKGAKSCISYERIHSLQLFKDTKDGMEDLGTLEIPEFEKKKKKVTKKVFVEEPIKHEMIDHSQHFDIHDPFFTDDRCPF